MATEFSRTLSLLRKEKAVNQRVVASALGISQALLSHYETGAREPGLNFIVKACDYYGVTADYLLGRTMLREGSVQPAQLEDAGEVKDNRLDGRSAAALFAKKLINNSISLLYDLAGRSRSNELVNEMTSYFGSAVYKLFRRFYIAAGENPDAFFSEPQETYLHLANADIEMAEAKIELLLASKTDGPDFPSLSHEMLMKEYSRLIQSLLTVTHQAANRGKKRLQQLQSVK